MKRQTGLTARVPHRGVASVEFAIVAPILILLMFGIVEMGLMFRSAIQLNNVARDAARAAAAGESTTLIAARVAETASGLDATQLTSAFTYRAYIGDGVWGTTWYEVTDLGNYNTVPFCAQVRATITYNHHIMIPGLFRFLVDNQETGTRTLTAAVTMTRT